MTLVQAQQPFIARQDNDAGAQFQRVQHHLPITPHRYASRIVTAAYTCAESDDAILANATGGAFTVTMPAAASYPGRRYTVVRTNGGGNAVTVAAVLGGNITLGAQYDRAEVQSCLTTAPATFSWVRVGA